MDAEIKLLYVKYYKSLYKFLINISQISEIHNFTGELKKHKISVSDDRFRYSFPRAIYIIDTKDHEVVDNMMFELETDQKTVLSNVPLRKNQKKISSNMLLPHYYKEVKKVNVNQFTSTKIEVYDKDFFFSKFPVGHPILNLLKERPDDEPVIARYFSPDYRTVIFNREHPRGKRISFRKQGIIVTGKDVLIQSSISRDRLNRSDKIEHPPDFMFGSASCYFHNTWDRIKRESNNMV